MKSLKNKNKLRGKRKVSRFTQGHLKNLLKVEAGICT